MTSAVVDDYSAVADEDGAVTYRIHYVGDITDKKARRVLAELHEVKCSYPGCVIEFVINSGGGSMSGSDAIYSELYSMSAQGGGGHFVRTKVRGRAGSGAGLIFQAGDERIGGKFDQLLFHEPLMIIDKYTFVSSIEQDVASCHAWTQRYLDVLEARATVPREVLSGLLGPRDCTLFMGEAVELGLADRLE